MEKITLDLIEKRASCKKKQTDFAQWSCPNLLPPASLELARQVEEKLGCSLWHDHLQVLTTIANGYFGPGNGLLHLLLEQQRMMKKV